jgi:hypothetical protein
VRESLKTLIWNGKGVARPTAESEKTKKLHSENAGRFDCKNGLDIHSSSPILSEYSNCVGVGTWDLQVARRARWRRNEYTGDWCKVLKQ